jgi:hypothetical protein
MMTLPPEKRNLNRVPPPAADHRRIGHVSRPVLVLVSATVSDWSRMMQRVRAKSRIPDFPAFSLLLRESLLGRCSDVKMVGIGDGPYRIDYFSGADWILGSTALSGRISSGQTEIGRLK